MLNLFIPHVVIRRGVDIFFWSSIVEIFRPNYMIPTFNVVRRSWDYVVIFEYELPTKREDVQDK